MNTCPVCGLEGIPPDNGQCPQCKADLTCFKVLDSLPDESPGQKLPPSRIPGTVTILGALAALFSALSAFLFFQFKQVDHRLQDQQRVLLESLRHIDERLDRLAREKPMQLDGAAASESEAKDIAIDTPEEKTEEAHPPHSGSEIEMQAQDGAVEKHEPKEEEKDVLPAENAISSEAQFWTYYSNGKDTLWALSEKYFGSGSLYPVLLELNPTIGVFTIDKGDPIKILKDGGLAREIYDRITGKEGRKHFWYYTVVEGDTPKSIASRFFKKDHEAIRRLEIGPSVPLKAGQKIRIFLE